MKQEIETISGRFQYDQLGDGQIRLVRLHQTFGRKEFCLKLKTYELEDAPKFCTLSYCWGTPFQSERVHCEAQQSKGYLPLTPNLLRTLRKINKHRLADGLPLWIDQICIDQENNSERAHQVKLMGDVYGRAERTLIHLGNDGKKFRDANDCLSKPVRYYFDTAIYFAMHITCLAMCFSTTEPARGTAVLRRLLKTPWFGRLWVVQEFAMSRDRFVICGRKAIPWDKFYRSMDPDKSYNRLTGMLNELHSLADKGQETDRDFYHLLDSFVLRNVSEPHDKIFALLGLGESLDSLAAAVDYDEPFFRTAIRTVHVLIEQSETRWHFNRYEFLHFVDPKCSALREYGPTWMPTFGIDQNPQAAQVKKARMQWLELKDGPTSTDVRLSARGILIDVLSEKLSRAHKHNMIRPDEHLLSTDEPEDLYEWRTQRWFHIEAHEVCESGDMIYVLDSLHTPCILRREGASSSGQHQYFFLGFATSPVLGLGASCVRDDEVAAEAYTRMRYSENSDIDERQRQSFRDEVWEPWLRGEAQVYPFETENIVLI